jgi:transposase
MSILRRCRGSCSNPRRCLEHLWFDVMYAGARYRMAANDFAVPRMEPGKQRPIESMDEARQWERLFIGELHAGREPRRPRKRRAASDTTPKTVGAFLDACMERCVKPAGLRSLSSVQSRASVLKQYLGDLPLDALEEPDEINVFKTESNYAEEVEIATVHRALELLRAAMNWGMAQAPPMFRKSPFHRFGVRMDKKLETSRDRRLTREEEKRLLDTALEKMNDGEHQFAGPLLHDRIVGAIELVCRRGEMLLIQQVPFPLSPRGPGVVHVSVPSVPVALAIVRRLRRRPVSMLPFGQHAACACGSSVRATRVDRLPVRT